MSTNNKSGLNFDHARTKEQTELMKIIKKDGVCPFCWEHFEKYHPKPIIKKTDYWIMTENMSPYEGTRVHYIFVYKDHITMPSDVSAGGFIDLMKLLNEVILDEKIKGGSFLMRFGDTSFTGGSVEHLHAHLVVGGPKKEGAEKIVQKFGYKI